MITDRGAMFLVLRVVPTNTQSHTTLTRQRNQQLQHYINAFIYENDILH